jgi:tetratricopeptide (TPR) repeat protein
MRVILGLLLTFYLSYADNNIADEIALEGIRVFHEYDYKKSIYLLNNALKTYKNENDKRKIRLIYTTLAKSYFFVFDYKNAEIYFKKALSIEKEFSQKNYSLLMDLTAFIAFSNELQKDYDEALIFLDAVSIMQKKYYKNYEHLNNLYLSYYVVYKEKKMYKKATNYLYKALEAEKANGITQERLHKYRLRVLELKRLMYKR